MKRAKIMLIAIAVLATVGGALAFKASKVALGKYCTTTEESAKCIDFVNATHIFPGTAAFTVYYTTTSGTSCPQDESALDCVSTTKRSFSIAEQ